MARILSIAWILACDVNMSSDVQNVRSDGVNISVHVNISMREVNMSSDVQNISFDGVNISNRVTRVLWIWVQMFKT